ncbi:MAG: hotdog domain-containing protein [Tepidimonas sp.]|uniref:acyl-CoA thioesterase n=1 Tax=Tepidimonas sp. TaxID=2002775 RepID=UPI00259D3B30|nr:acyl-CoA thioesterase [Tepidimonas sp.]MDM7456261.1 hotdog domain-containing protein [Tepidimonas sp.]
MSDASEMERARGDVHRTLTVVDMAWPDQCNHHGTLFGGAALSWLDRAAFILASRELGGAVVTAALDQVQFSAPLPSGHLGECQARIVRRGRRSATVRCDLIGEDLLLGSRQTCLQADFVMVRREADDSDAAAPTEDRATTVDEGDAHVAEIVFPGHVNHRGVLHGGPAMAWLAKCGFVAATRRLRRPLVMARADRLDFLAPARVGDVVDVRCRVEHVGRRSIAVRAVMDASDPVGAHPRRCCEVLLTYVALSD